MVKVKVRINFTPNMPLETQREEERYSSTRSLTSALDGGGWSMPRPGRFVPKKENRHPFHRKQGVTYGRFGGLR